MAYKFEHGRRFHAYKEGSYRLYAGSNQIAMSIG